MGEEDGESGAAGLDEEHGDGEDEVEEVVSLLPLDSFSCWFDEEEEGDGDPYKERGVPEYGS